MLMVGDFFDEPFLPHLVVCGLFNHYTYGARHISMGCLDFIASSGVLGPLWCRPLLASFSLLD